MIASSFVFLVLTRIFQIWIYTHEIALSSINKLISYEKKKKKNWRNDKKWKEMEDEMIIRIEGEEKRESICLFIYGVYLV